MKTPTFSLVLVAVLAGAVLFPACTLPEAQPAATVSSQVTQAVAVTATQEAPAEMPETTTTAAQATFQAQTITPSPAGAQTPQAAEFARPTAICELAAAGSPIDVTIPDDSEFMPGEAFTKIWRLENAGSCAWSKDYSAELFSGQSLGATSGVFLSEEVAPGESVDIAVDLVAPEAAGKYQGNWKLRNPDSQWFGIGPDGKAPFWVRIVVVEVPTETPASPTEPVSPPATPPVHSSGRVELAVGETLDLDLVSKNSDAGVDLIYQTGDDQRHRLEPAVDGVLLAIFAAGAPEFTDCVNADLTSQAIILEDMPLEIAICYRTDQGLPGRVFVSRDDLSDFSLSMDALTWSLP